MKAVGGDADPLALLLTGEGAAVEGATDSPFPATLQAMLGEGLPTSDASDPSEAGDVTDLLALGKGDDDDATGDPSLEAALAVALGVVANPQATAPDAGDGGDAKAGDGTAIDANAKANANANAAAAAGKTAVDLTAATAPGDASATTTIGDVAQNRAAEAEIAIGQTAVDAAPTPPTPIIDEKAGGKSAATAQVDLVDTARATQPVANASLDLASTRPTPDAHGAGAGTHTAVDATGLAAQPFSSGGSTQHHGLDLGSPERQASTLKPTEALTTATAPTAAAAPAIEKLHALPASGTAAPASTETGSADVTHALAPVGATNATAETATARAAHAVQHPGGIEARWGERVVDALRLSGVRGGGEIRLQLEPEGLGHIDVRLHLQPDGVRAVIVAEHESTRALLTSQQHVLQDAFNRSDLRLSGFSVDVGSGGHAASSSFNEAGGQAGGQAPSTQDGSTPTARAADTVEPASTPLANGRVSVRV